MDLALDLAKLAGLRNIPVHRYTDIDLEMLYKVSRRICKDIPKRFIEWVNNIDP